MYFLYIIMEQVQWTFSPARLSMPMPKKLPLITFDANSSSQLSVNQCIFRYVKWIEASKEGEQPHMPTEWNKLTQTEVDLCMQIWKRDKGNQFYLLSKENTNLKHRLTK